MAYQRLSVQHPQVLGDSFWSQGDCTDHFVEENLSPNSHSLTQTDCSHIQTDLQRAWNSFLIHKHRQIATHCNQSELVYLGSTHLRCISLQ